MAQPPPRFDWSFEWQQRRRWWAARQVCRGAFVRLGAAASVVATIRIAVAIIVAVVVADAVVTAVLVLVGLGGVHHGEDVAVAVDAPDAVRVRHLSR